METALKAIAQPHRRKILLLVRDQEMSAGEIAKHFDMSRPGVSQHLTTLKNARLVSERRLGTQRLYSANAEGLTDVRNFIESFWDKRLTALKQQAELLEHNRSE